MHWTLQIMFGLCAACFTLNMVQCIMVGSVRVSGILICYTWALQQMMWTMFGYDLELFTLICDAAVGVALWRFCRRDWIILLILPFTSICTIFEWWNGGHTALSWWVNRGLVATQMALGLPRITRQFGDKWVTHGPLARCDPCAKDYPA